VTILDVAILDVAILDVAILDVALLDVTISGRPDRDPRHEAARHRGGRRWGRIAHRSLAGLHIESRFGRVWGAKGCRSEDTARVFPGNPAGWREIAPGFPLE
jgi:hypothetical protein